MNKNTLRIILTLSLLTFSGAAHAKKGKKDGKKGKGAKNSDNSRKGWVKEFDHNGDGRWRGFFGKDMRKFKKAHPQPYEKLVKWCERASEKPNKFDVNFPKGENEKKFKCKKKKVDEPYLKAWIKDAKEDDKDDKPATRGPGTGVRR